MINSQLTIQDKEAIEKFILQGQNKNTDLFFENINPLKHTKQAISALKILDIEVKYKKEICKKLSEINAIDHNLIAIDKLLDCKIDFKKYKPDLNKSKLVDLYNEALILDTLNLGK